MQLLKCPIRSCRRRHCSLEAGIYAIFVCVAVCLVLVLLLTYIPTRNFLLAPVLPGLWRSVPTSRLISVFTAPDTRHVGDCSAMCPKVKVKTSRDSLKQRHVDYHDHFGTKMASFYPAGSPAWNFLPLLSREEKMRQLHILDVLVDLLDQMEIDYFLINGALLGVVRHRGIIPWDDDLDLAISIKHWSKVKETLCCLQGYSVALNDNMHWKFFQDSSPAIRTAPGVKFPFVDVFFYDSDSDYVWAVNDYTRPALLYPASHVFPLDHAPLDGRMYSVPRHAEKLVREEFHDLTTCVSPSNIHRFNHALKGHEISTLPCKDLSHLYKIYE